ncbi:hypothetical protein D3C72_2329290 [compost metagenome]
MGAEVVIPVTTFIQRCALAAKFLAGPLQNGVHFAQQSLPAVVGNAGHGIPGAVAVFVFAVFKIKVVQGHCVLSECG